MVGPFERWLHRSHPGVKFEVYQLTPIEDWLPGYTEIRVHCETAELMTVGTAQARNPSVALVKAAAEAVERAVCLPMLGPDETTSGFAVHRTAALARERARLELLERDVYLCHHLTNTPFGPISERVSGRHAEFQGLRERLAKIGITLRAGVMPISARHSAVLCAAFGRDHRPRFGTVIGLGCELSVAAALTKAVLECWTGLFPMVCGVGFKARSRRALARLKHLHIRHHEAFALSADGAALLQTMFDGEPPRLVVHQPTRHTRFEVWRPLPPPFETCPLVLARASDATLQPLFFGLPRVLNDGRLRAFTRDRALRYVVPNRTSLHLLP